MVTLYMFAGLWEIITTDVANAPTVTHFQLIRGIPRLKNKRYLYPGYEGAPPGYERVLITGDRATYSNRGELDGFTEV